MTPGTIAVPCADLARYSAFWTDLHFLNTDHTLAIVRGMDVTSNLNTIFREMLEGDWVWIMGDDHTFDKDILNRLLERDVDVVVPMCAKKSPPFNLVSFKSEEMVVYESDGKEYPHYTYVTPADLPTEGGLMKVHAVGSAGMLVRRHVIDAIGDPWFENSTGTVINDDLEFCRKIRDAGFDIWLDTDEHLGHIGHFTVYPSRRDDSWGVYLDFGGKGENRIFMKGT